MERKILKIPGWFLAQAGSPNTFPRLFSDFIYKPHEVPCEFTAIRHPSGIQLAKSTFHPCQNYWK